MIISIAFLTITEAVILTAGIRNQIRKAHAQEAK